MTGDFMENSRNGGVDEWDSSPYHTGHIKKCNYDVLHGQTQRKIMHVSLLIMY
jgi:hypothetical protein